MGIPLKEQLDNPHPKATKNCEGCWGAGWLTAQVDSLTRLDEAGLTEPASFLMRCDECEVFSNDVDAAVVARKAGMEVNEHLVVAYTEAQLEFLKVKPIERPKLWLIHWIASFLPPEPSGETELPPQVLCVSVDGDHKSAEIIVDIYTDEGIKEFAIGTSGIRELEDE